MLLALNKVYAFDPVVESMTSAEAKHVLGGQANLWSDITQKHFRVYAFPKTGRCLKFYGHKRIS
jgi:hexosaminidase